MAFAMLNTRLVALIYVTALLLGMLPVRESADERTTDMQVLQAATDAPAGGAVVNRGAAAELQQLRDAEQTFLLIERPANQPGNDWPLLSSDAHPLGSPTLQAQAVRLQI